MQMTIDILKQMWQGWMLYDLGACYFLSLLLLLHLLHCDSTGNACRCRNYCLSSRLAWCLAWWHKIYFHQQQIATVFCFSLFVPPDAAPKAYEAFTAAVRVKLLLTFKFTFFICVRVVLLFVLLVFVCCFLLLSHFQLGLPYFSFITCCDSLCVSKLFCCYYCCCYFCFT